MSSQSQDKSADRGADQAKQKRAEVADASEPVSERQSLPFEPKSRKAADIKSNAKPKSQPIRGDAKSSANPSAKPGAQPKAAGRRSPQDSGIPQVVSRRMARRMALFSGIPTALGMLTFVVSYFFVSRDLVELPTYAVLLVSLGWFGLGVLGLTYGVLSASWEEDATGSRLGIGEFKTNLGRTTGAWRENAEKAKAARAEAAQQKADKKSSKS